MEENEVKRICETKKGHVRGHSLPIKSTKKPKLLHNFQLGLEDNQYKSKNMQENPKRGWWVSSKMEQNGKSYFCKQCGKGFKSAKAVFGHMRCHSKKKDEQVEEKKQSNNITPRKKRSVGRYKINPSSNNSSRFNLNTCSSVIDEELVDIAASLLMLANGGFYNAVDHFSDDDSVKMDENFPIDSALNVVQQCGSNMEFANDDVNHNDCPYAVLKSPIDGDVEATQQCDIDTEFVDNGNGAEGVSVWEPRLNFDVLRSGFDSTMQKFEEIQGSFCELSKSMLENCESRLLADVEIGSELSHDTGFLVEETIKVPQRGTVYGNLSPSSSAPIAENPNGETNEGECRKHICYVGNKTYQSYQALGGHRLHCPLEKRLSYLGVRAPAKANNISSAITSQGSLMLEDAEDVNYKKQWTYNCQTCCKAFASGQAFGGHMRAHCHGNVGSNNTTY